MNPVDLSFLCTQHSVHERGLRAALQTLIELNESRCSVAKIAERNGYSEKQMRRFIGALKWHDDTNPPVVVDIDGGRRIPCRRRVNVHRAAELGLFDYAA